MDKSKQPKMATPEQNAEFNRQLKDVLVNNGIALANTSTEGRDRHTVIGDKTYSQLLNVITSLSENTRNTHQVWSFLESTLKLNTDSISKQQEDILNLRTITNEEILELKTLTKAMQLRIEKLERALEPIIIDCSLLPKIEKRLVQLENEHNIIYTDYKMVIERVNKLEKLK